MRTNVSVAEARELLGESADRMTDEDLLEVLNTLDLLAKDAVENARRKVIMHSDAKDLANLIYDIYQNKKSQEAKKKRQ